jgi:hypothetical protein
VWNARKVRAPVAAVPGQDTVHPSPTRSSGSKSSAGPKPTMRAPVAAASAAAPGAWSTCVCVVDVRVRDEDGADRAQRGGGGHDGGGVHRVGRAGVDDDRLGAPHEVGVRPRSGHEARVGGGQAQDASTHLIHPARLRGGADAEVRHRRNHGRSVDCSPGRGPGAVSGPSSLARMETSRTASLKSPRALPSSGSGTAPRS